jgi:hypothetical protein
MIFCNQLLDETLILQGLARYLANYRLKAIYAFSPNETAVSRKSCIARPRAQTMIANA